MKSNEEQHYRLGLDVGSNSLGWFVIWLDENGNAKGLGPGGVRIFSDGRDPQSKTSNAADRRVARGARRRRDRYLKRRTKLMALLVGHGLMPKEEVERKKLEALDPYKLRATALDGPLPAHHVGRAIFHLNQRRGFLSNRKTEKGDSESGAIKEAAKRLDTYLETSGARTLGEFLYGRHRARLGVRARNRSTGPGKADYEFYPTRQLLLDEFDAIWTAQAPHHPSMTEDAHSAIRHEIFYQRPLKQPPVGKCSLEPAHDATDAEGFRCPWAHPLAQRFRIWQEVRNLAVTETGKPARPLSKEDGDKIALALFQKNSLSFDRIRSLLKLPPEARLNLENEKRKDLDGDLTAAKLAHKNFFGNAWRSLSLDRQIEIVARLEEEQEEAALIAWLTANASLDAETADRIASAFLPDGHCRLGLRAIKKLVPLMESGMTKTEAENAAGYQGAHQADGELSLNGRLPYYGEWLQDDVLGTGDPRDTSDKRWGRFPNPTVHIGLGQIRRVVNALVRDHGPPAQVAIEMTRDFKLSPQALAKLEKEQAENQKKNEARAVEIVKHGQPANGRNRLKMRLWEELNPSDPLDRRCPYTGEMIGIARLLSSEVDIDHLIPFSVCWDDSAANKIVCLTEANRRKGNKTPFDAFGATAEWADIAMRAAGLPHNKRWRFAPDALQRFDAAGGFLARQLNETGWLARLAKQYLTAVSNPNGIYVLPGKLTALIRGKWGLNELLPDHNFSDAKNRKDHRHHAIDAMVAALTDRSLLHRMSSAYDTERQRIEVPPPWEALRDDLKSALDRMTVSFKPDHGTQGQLHEDTAYGAVEQVGGENGGNLVYRKRFLDLNDKEISRIRDARLRDTLIAHVNDAKAAGGDLKAALQSFAVRRDLPGMPNGIRHVRLTKAEKPEYLVQITGKDGASYKAYSAGENAFLDIYESPDGAWSGEAVTVYRANQSGNRPAWMSDDPRPRFVMRVFKDDLLRVHLDGSDKVVRVVRLEPSAKRLRLAEHNETGNLQARHDDPNDPFRWIFGTYGRLKEGKAERVRVDEIGKVWRIRPEEAERSL